MQRRLCLASELSKAHPLLYTGTTGVPKWLPFWQSHDCKHRRKTGSQPFPIKLGQAYIKLSCSPIPSAAWLREWLQHFQAASRHRHMKMI